MSFSSGSGSVPFISDSDLEETANRILLESKSVDEIPIPIEKIIELTFRLDIVPVPGLNNFDLVGYLDSGLTAIYVDENIYEKSSARYRFTLAHELSHLILHKDYLPRPKGIATAAAWRDLICSIPLGTYTRMEYQANTLAGMILVPTKPLVTYAADLAKIVKSNGLQTSSPEVQPILESELAKTFEVSSQVINIRAQKMKLWEVVK